MVIDYSNGEVVFLTSLNMHDHIFNGIQFDYGEKKIYAEITATGSSNQKYAIEFINVIGFEMVSCDFWGKSPHILDFEFIKPHEHRLLKKLLEEGKNNNYFCSNLYRNKTYIETVLVFASGDRLTIACECIRVDTGDKGQGDGCVNPIEK